MTLILGGLGWLCGLAFGLVYGGHAGLVWTAGLAGLSLVLAPGQSALRIAALFLAATLLGTWRGSMAAPDLQAGPLTHLRGQRVSIHGTVDEPPRCSATCLFTLQVRAVETSVGAESIEGLVQVRTGPRGAPGLGDSVAVNGVVEAPRPISGFPRVELLARRGIHEVLEYPTIRRGPPVEAPPNRFELARLELERRLTASIPGTEGQLAAGLLLGREVRLPPELEAQLRTTGTSHILAVSGFNVAILAGMVFGIANRLVARPWALGIAGICVLLYTLLVGAPPSAVRASQMLAAAGVASVVGRLPDPLTALVLSAGLMSAFEPMVVLDLGFQLSFAATAGLVLLGSRLTPTWRVLPGWVSGGLGLTLAAQIMTLPLVLYTFHSVSLVATATNVLIGPALPLLMGLSTMALAIADLSAISAVVSALGWLVAHYVLSVVEWTARWPLASLSTGALPLWGVLSAYATILIPIALPPLAKALRGSISPVWARAAGGLGIVGLIGITVVVSIRPGSAGQLRAVFIDLPTGGLTMIETPSGRRAVLGSAGSPLAATALAEQMPLLDNSIDLLVVMRTGERDLDGLVEIARRYPVRMVVQPRADGDGWQDWRRLLDQNGTQHLTAEGPMSLELDASASLEIDELVEAGSSRIGSLNTTLRFGRLELQVLGGKRSDTLETEGTVVIRLPRELALSEALREQAGRPGSQVAVIGGRRDQSEGRDSLQLGPGEIIELTSDGAQTRLRKIGCQSSSVGPCFWPNE